MLKGFVVQMEVSPNRDLDRSLPVDDRWTRLLINHPRAICDKCVPKVEKEQNN